MYCPECGREVIDDSVFCENCGYKLTVEKYGKVDEAVNPTAKNDKPAKKRTWIAVVGIIIVLSVALGLIFYSMTGINRIINAFGDSSATVREETLQKLIDKGEKAVDPLINALKNDDQNIREYSATALGEIGDVRAVEPLINLLNDDYDSVKTASIKALETIGEPSVDNLIEALGNEDESIRSGSIIALGQIGDARAVEPLVNLLNDDSVQTVLIESLAAFGDTAIGNFIEALGNADEKIRNNAIEILCKIGEPAIQNLIEALGHGDENVRNNAINVLERIGEPAAQGLITALTGSDKTISENAYIILAEMGYPVTKDLSGDNPHLLVEQTFPSNGTIVSYTDDEAIAPLEIVTSSDDTYYFLKLSDYSTDTDVMAVFIQPGQTVDINVPLGSYQIKYATGDIWYGEEDLFGPNTSCSKLADVFDFTISGDTVYGYTIELIMQTDGNLGIDGLSINDF